MLVVPGLSAHAQDHRAARSATGGACPWVGMMAKLTMPTATAAGLTVRERVLLYCAASGTDWQHAGVTGEHVTTMVVKGLISRDAGGQIALTDNGRAVLRATLPDL